MGEATLLLLFFVVVHVRFEESNYRSREESGQVTVCLVKDLETAAGFVVQIITSDDTASGTYIVTFSSRVQYDIHLVSLNCRWV